MWSLDIYTVYIYTYLVPIGIATTIPETTSRPIGPHASPLMATSYMYLMTKLVGTNSNGPCAPVLGDHAPEHAATCKLHDFGSA